MNARRTEVRLTFEGVDISTDINKHLLSLTYTDNEEDKTDDLQLSLDDREGIWLGNWLNTPAQPPPTPEKKEKKSGNWKIGDEVTVSGKPQYSSYGTGNPGATLTNYKGKITYLNLKDGISFPIHVDQKGWFAESQVTKADEKQEEKKAGKSTMTQSAGAKGAEISAVIVQKNWESDGKDRVLDCGVFQVDSVDGSGPPAKVTIKAGSIPYTSTIRTQKKTKAWEKIKLSGIAKEVAATNGLKCLYESLFDPLYDRREQVLESDIVFLKRLCKAAGISLKVTAKMIVLFDASEYEKKATVRTIKRGSADYSKYTFGTSFHDTAYSSCRVKYTEPKTKKTFEATYTAPDAAKDGSGQKLEINEKVSSNAEALKLAEKRLREKNSQEYKASFNLAGDARLVAGVTVKVEGFGAFDGKYIIETASHTISSSGYKTNITLRRVLEGY